MDNEIAGPSQRVLVSNQSSATGAEEMDIDSNEDVKIGPAQFLQNVNEVQIAPVTGVDNIYTFEEIPVRFPYEENLSQHCMREVIIKALKEGFNCLIESPNGTGKTASLLCSLLGWQQYCYEKNDYGVGILNQAIESLGACTCLPSPSVTEFPTVNSPSFNSVPNPRMASPLENRCRYCIKKYMLDQMASVSRPLRVYYVTRTHSQIAQAVQQLKTTHYRTTRMSILASRDQTCLSQMRNQKPNLSANDICRAFRNQCRFYHQENEGSQFSKFQKEKGAFDLEELIQEGQNCTKCPYYGGIEMKVDADIIFCTYNYLLNPSIRRKTIGNDHLNSVIVFDEAHNVEDACRDALTFVLDVHKLEMGAIKSLDELITTFEGGVADVATESLRKILAHLGNWCAKIKEGDVNVEWMGADLQEKLTELGITTQIVNECLEGLEPYLQLRVSARRINVFLQDLQQTLEYFSQEAWGGIGGMEDFGGQICRHRTPEDGPNYSLHICCLNPAVAFRHLRNSAHSIIAASGTLKPFDSIREELKTSFASLDLTGKDSSNIWAGVVTHGIYNPSKALNLKYENQQDVVIHYEIGEIINQICRIIPNGILVLFPSYALMNGMRKTWERQPAESPVINRINEQKPIFFENDLRKFKEDFNAFRLCAQQPKGAILFAVFGGKFSEGTDFKDELARAIITIGIPFPKLFDPFISLKRSYNETKKKPLGHWDWYENKAFNTFSNGIGRCIRHPNDWAAVIMIEERLGNGKYDRPISDLIGSAPVHYSANDLEAFMNSLAEFANVRYNHRYQ